MPRKLIDDAMGDPRNVAALAIASDLAYLPSAEAAPRFRKEFDMDSRLISVDNTQVYILENDEAIVLAFRGTEAPTSLDGIKDWLLTDAGNLLIVPSGRLGTDLAAAGVGAKFHQGFVGAIAEIWEPLRDEVETAMKKSERPLWITGHSLGGALALLSGWLLHRRMTPVHQIYTYGAPMIGNIAAAKAFEKEFSGQIYRCVNAPDPIPKLPTISMLASDYGHCPTEIGLGETLASTGDFFKGLLGRIVQGNFDASLIDELWKRIQGRLDAHAVINYKSLIARKFGLKD